MKKTLCLIMLVLLAVSTLPAVESEETGPTTSDPSYSGGLENAQVSTNVSLNISGESGSATKIELYFLDALDNGQSDTSEAPTNTQPSVALAFNDTANVADNTAENSGVYAWWRVLYGGNLNISLGIDKPLSQAGQTETIDWEATVTPIEKETTDAGEQRTATQKTVYSTESTGKKKTEIFDSHAGTNGVRSFGQAEIKIKTDVNENYSNIPAGTYSANLILTCTTVQ